MLRSRTDRARRQESTRKAPLIPMIAIHAGFVKTATSTLQRGVFSQHEGINFLGLSTRDDRLRAAIHAIAKTDFDLLRHGAHPGGLPSLPEG